MKQFIWLIYDLQLLSLLINIKPILNKLELLFCKNCWPFKIERKITDHFQRCAPFHAFYEACNFHLFLSFSSFFMLFKKSVTFSFFIIFILFHALTKSITFSLYIFSSVSMNARTLGKERKKRFSKSRKMIKGYE